MIITFLILVLVMILFFEHIYKKYILTQTKDLLDKEIEFNNKQLQELLSKYK